MEQDIPNGGQRIVSTLRPDNTVEVALVDMPVDPPGPDQVLLRVEAAPINPSDIMPMLAGADPQDASFGGTAERPVVTASLAPQLAEAMSARQGVPMAIGLEGAGTVVATGAEASGLAGKKVAFLSLAMGSLGQYCTVSMNDCMPLPEGVTSEQGADLFCNPMTALAMIETLRQTGQTALVHTAAASNLGQMLVRICREDGIPLVNVVRREEQVELLRSLGAEHVCNSSEPTFFEDLCRAVAKTGATAAFDAIGGGDTTDFLLRAMEAGAVSRMPGYSPYGSLEPKHVYIYGHLGHGPTVLPRANYGMVWSVAGWAMPPVLERAGPERSMELTRRVADNLTTTFASHYGHRISLAEALQREAMLGYCKQATGQKYLVLPWE